MDYPIVYDKFETNFLNYGVGVLDTVNDPFIFQRLNGEQTLEFDLPLYDEKAELIVVDNFVKYAGQLYIIREKKEIKAKSGETLYVFCEHVFTELLDDYIELLTLDRVTGQHALDEVLEGTRFTGNAGSLGTALHDVTVEKTNPLKGINKIIDRWRCEIELDNYNVTLKPQIGNDYGVQFRYRKNLDSIKRTVDARGVITRLHVYGKDDLKTVLDSQYIGDYPRPKVGQVTFSELITMETLEENGGAHLAANEVPRVTYEMAVIELKHLTEYGIDEAFNLGDTITVIDEDLGINVKARIFEYKFYPNSLEKSTVVLGNFIPSAADDMSKLKETKDTVDKVFGGGGGGGKISTSWLDGVIDANRNQLIMSGSYINSEVIDGKGMLFENTDSVSGDHGALYIGPGILAIASAKDGQGEWIWRTFGKGTGFTADELNAGKIRTALIQIVGEENLFYWDAGALYCKDATNQNKQIRLSKLGIQLTTNGGSSWDTALDYNGLTVTAPDINPNLLQNGGAEISTGAKGAGKPDGWDYVANNGAQANRRTGDQWVISGKYSFELNGGALTAPSGQEQPVFFQDVTNIIAAVPYTVSCLAGAHRTNAVLAVFMYNSVGSIIDNYSDFATNSTPQQITITFTPPAGTTKIRVYLIKHPTFSGQPDSYAFFDDVKLEKAGSRSPYIEGDLGAAAAISNGVQQGVSYNSVVINGTGIRATHANGDYTQLSVNGLKRHLASGSVKDFNYLTAAGSSETGSSGAYFDTGGGQYVSGTPNGGGIANVTITLPADFQGKTFTVSLSVKSSSAYTMSQRDGDPYYVPFVDLGNYLEIVSYNYAAGSFVVKGYGSHMILKSADSTLWSKYWALQFSYMAVV